MFERKLVFVPLPVPVFEREYVFIPLPVLVFEREYVFVPLPVPVFERKYVFVPLPVPVLEREYVFVSLPVPESVALLVCWFVLVSNPVSAPVPVPVPDSVSLAVSIPGLALSVELHAPERAAANPETAIPAINPRSVERIATSTYHPERIWRTGLSVRF